MAGSFKNKRIKFRKSEQRLFIEKSRENLGLTNVALANLLKVNKRTLADWKREKYLIPMTKAVELSKKSGIAFPKKFKIKEPFWYTKIGALRGGLAVYKKYGYVGGDPVKRKRAWIWWWNTKGKNIKREIMEPKSVLIPSKNEFLAEFVGIMIGDGGISKNQVTITLHSKDDYEYSIFVTQLIKKLFNLIPGAYYHKKAQAMRLVISRTSLVSFCEKIGLKIGNKIKQKIDVPIWIKRRADFQKSCIRGLIDTDGSLVIHKYKINNKQYCYKKLNFCSASKPLVESIIKMLKTFDFNARLSHNGRNVWIDNQNEVKRYFQIIGSNNPKHNERFLR